MRGLRRTRRGHHEPPRVDAKSVRFSYLGEDGVLRETLVELSPEPDRIQEFGDRVEAEFRLLLAAHQTKLVSITISPIIDGALPTAIDFDAAVHVLRRSYEDWERECTQIVTDNELFDQLLMRGLRDLRALYTPYDGGGVLAAGIPWYVAVFGRDSLIASHQLLTINPRTAREGT